MNKTTQLEDRLFAIKNVRQNKGQYHIHETNRTVIWLQDYKKPEIHVQEYDSISGDLKASYTKPLSWIPGSK